MNRSEQALELDEASERDDEECPNGSECEAGNDEALSPEEERFVEMFVEYWIRRGAQLVRSSAPPDLEAKPASELRQDE